LGLSNLAEDARFADPTARDDLYAEVGPLVAERIAEHEKAELFNTLGTLRVSAGAVLDVAELTEDPHLAARDFFVSVPIGDAGDVLLPGAPFTAPESGWAIRARAPGAGEHSASVLSESGFSTDEVERLMRHGVVS
jgi:crotonobetainyl-CoA:carnitine CoA-transferase CaiB-like acyl-CoA transferase